jgi:hypothetical protein
MLILTIAHILLTIGIIAGFGYYVRRRTRALYKYEMLSRLARRMREHDNDYPIFYPTQTSTQFQKDKRQTIKTRKEELSEVAKWLELV